MNLPSEKPIVLTIAGLDPSSGAGLTADIRTFENIGVFGMSVITAITVQNAKKVHEWSPVESDSIRKQLEGIFSSYDIKYVKTGMLGAAETVEIIEEYRNKYDFNIIVDPVTISGTGIRIAEKKIEKVIKEILFPLAHVITVNKNEAEFYSGKKITNITSVKDVCNILLEMGPKNIILKGGHINEDGVQIIDYLYNKDFFRFYPRKRINYGNSNHIHGTGCVFSSLITGFLALGYNIQESIFFTEDFMESTFKKLFPLKKGIVLDTGYTYEEIDVLKAVQMVVDFLSVHPGYSRFVPEVRTNVAISKKNARNLNEIAAVDGRVTVIAGTPKASGPIRFGASNHTGRLLLKAKQLDNEINAVINIKFDLDIIEKLKNTRLSLVSVDRLKSNADIRIKEQSSMGWIVQEAHKQLKKIPDIIWDSGEPEKEPMIRLFAKNAYDLINKLEIFLNLE